MKKFIFFVFLSFCLISCKTKERIVETVRTDTCYVDRWQRDSIYIETLKHDSVLIREKGDSVLIERWHTQYVDRWRDRIVHDSIYIAHTDTLRQTVTVPATLSHWQRFRMSLGNIALLVLLIFAGVSGAKIFKLLRK